MPTRAERIGRSVRYRFERAGPVEVRVAEATLGPGSVPDLDAVLAERAGVPPQTPLTKDPPGSGYFHTPLELPRQIRLRQLREGSAAAAVMVGVESRRDLDVAEKILESATLDPKGEHDPMRLLGVAVDPPVGTVAVAGPGPMVVFESTNPAIDGGLTVGWVPAGIEIDDGFLESSLRDLLREKIGVTDAELDRVEHGGLRGYASRGETAATGEYHVCTLAVPGETDGLFMVHASAKGEGAQALMRVLDGAARSLRVEGERK